MGYLGDEKLTDKRLRTSLRKRKTKCLQTEEKKEDKTT